MWLSGSTPAVTPSGKLGQNFDPKRNSLNFLRLVLALTVIASHAIGLGQFGNDWIGNRSTIGEVAVYGFFGISGYLIAGSAVRNSFGRYLWQRFLRIFPAFWVCLVVTAFGFGVIAWLYVPGHGSLWTYLTQSGGPIDYLSHNYLLRIKQQTISGTLAGVPYASVWNGSLWTLFYEFVCYVMLGLLALTRILRRRLLVVLLAASVWVAEIVVTSVPGLNAHVNALNNPDLMRVLILVPIFLTGTLIYLYQETLPDSGWLAIGSGVLVVVGLALPLGNTLPGYTLTSMDLTAAFITYPLLWLGVHLPLQRVGATNDYSYGMYIYAFPIQQLLALWGIYRWGYVPYLLSAVVLTAAAAVASWWLIEKRALRLKAWSPRPAMQPGASPGSG
jgi:peptidoglycan/LPS O-acetylase OafA/YrhL